MSLEVQPRNSLYFGIVYAVFFGVIGLAILTLFICAKCNSPRGRRRVYSTAESSPVLPTSSSPEVSPEVAPATPVIMGSPGIIIMKIVSFM